MATPVQNWESYYGTNLGYIQEQYERFLQDPESVGPEYRELFATKGAPPLGDVGPSAAVALRPDADAVRNAIAAGKLVWNIRTYGHLAADIDPLGVDPKPSARALEPQTYGLQPSDLAALPAELVWEGGPPELTNGWEAIQRLLQAYTGTIAYEFGHVHDEKERKWLNDYAEKFVPAQKLNADERRKLMTRLVEAEQFEDFLHRTFVGARRFSVEGNDVLVAVVDEIVHELTNAGVRDITMGMAHRGRLNVLAHVLEKPYTKIFSEFHHSTNKNVSPSEGSIGISYGWSGDVKYHLGANRSIQTGQTAVTRLTLANNPSHLEYVNPVVQGFARAAQEDRSKAGFPVRNEDAAASIVVHGDAAFPGEGIVAETMNLGQLNGYRIGGTIHIIANNKLGFTTESVDSRSTHYASDVAKGYEIPIVHVNADDPEACIAAARMATEYRRLFKKDFLIDLIGYRRYGHNETDDPETTQPLLYKKIKAHPTVSRLYANKLIAEGAFSEEQYDQIKTTVVDRLKAAYEEMKQREGQEAVHQTPAPLGEADAAAVRHTGVELEKLQAINSALLNWPEGFTVYPKLQKILERRRTALNDGEKVDWGHAEVLAFASILSDGTPIRLTGQDAERATFAFRNLILHDPETGALFCPLHHLPQAKASFAIHNSPLSESAVLGFEYGYNVFSPETMVIWEAQYGDFSNVAQVLIDQFISSGRSKWSEKSGLIMLLPHGYEGAGPEHSSARLERYLQLCAEENWTVANLSSSAQYFHLLRRQASLLGTDDVRPLVLMSPKSLIRNPRVASSPDQFANGTFQVILEQPGLGEKKDRVERLLLCSGKVAIDLEEALDKTDDKDWLHIVRVEQLYPFPAKEIAEVIARYPNLKEIVWVQEEPRNMGAWSFVEPRIREIAPSGVAVQYIGRPERSSPASGFQQVHAFEQQFVVAQSLKPTPTLIHNLGR